MSEQDDDLDFGPDDEETVAQDDVQDHAEGEDDAQDPPRDAQGRFVPLSALQSERQKGREAVTRAEKAERELAEARRPREQERTYTPEEQAQMRAQSERLDVFEEVARDRFGDEVVDAAQEWFKGLAQVDPWTLQAIQSARNPYRELLKRFESHLVQEELAEMGFDAKDPDAWVMQRAAQLQQQQQRGGAIPQPQSQAPPPRSLASQPSSGGGAGATRVGPGAAFDDVF